MIKHNRRVSTVLLRYFFIIFRGDELKQVVVVASSSSWFLAISQDQIVAYFLKNSSPAEIMLTTLFDGSVLESFLVMQQTQMTTRKEMRFVIKHGMVKM